MPSAASMTGRVRPLPSLRRPVRPAGQHGAEPAVARYLGQFAVGQRGIPLAVLDRAVAQHQVREIEFPFVRRHVGALGHEAHVAQGAGIDDLGELLLAQIIDRFVRAFVDRVEQDREAVAQVEQRRQP